MKEEMIEKGIKELIIREGRAQEILPPVPPLEKRQLKLSGTIETVSEFLRKRNHLFKADKCHIEINGTEMTFYGNECQDENEHITIVKGDLLISDEFKNMHVNDDMYFKATELARFLKMRKNLFPDKEQFLNVFSKLSSYEAEVKRQIKESKDNRTGSMESLIKQDVISNVPKSFTMQMPIYKNADPVRFEIEIDIDPLNLECTLLSFDLQAKIDELRNKLITRELEKEVKENVKLIDYCVVFYA